LCLYQICLTSRPMRSPIWPQALPLQPSRPGLHSHCQHGPFRPQKHASSPNPLFTGTDTLLQPRFANGYTESRRSGPHRRRWYPRTFDGRYLTTCTRLPTWAAGNPPPHRLQVCMEGTVHRCHHRGESLGDHRGERYHGPQFTSSLWAGLCDLLNIQHAQTTAYQLQSNGMVECFLCCLKYAQWARCAVANWMDHLPWVLLGLPSVAREVDNTTSAPPRQCSAHHLFYLANF
jgi:hypothetical protein